MNRKISIILSLIVVLSAPAIAGEVDHVDFDQLPTVWETGETLDVSVNVEGSGLDEVKFQSRDPSEPGYGDRRSKDCSGSTCNWHFTHTENEQGEYEYRFRAYAGSDRRNSDSQTVQYVDHLNYYVDWVEKPPETASENQEVSMSVQAYDSGERFDDEGVLKLQYFNGQGWETFDQRNCNTNSDRQRCSNYGEISLTSEKINSGEARFRGKIIFRGGVTETTSTETVTVSSGLEGEVDTITLEDLPNTAEEGSTFQVEADAEGTKLDRIIVQTKNPDDEGWTDWKSTSCSGSSCSFSEDYHVSGTGEKDFRARAFAGSDRKNSDNQSVNFVESTDPRVDSVNLQGPSEAEEGTSFDLNADATGRNLDEIMIQKRGPSGWTEWRSKSCDGRNSCSLTGTFNVPEGDTSSKDFRAKAFAGSDSEASHPLTVDFLSSVQYRIDSITLDELPPDHSINSDLSITGQASGQNLEEIVLEKRMEGTADWDNVETQSCSGSNECSFDYDFSTSRTEEIDFRLRVFAGPKEEESRIESVQFKDLEDEEDIVDTVTLEDLPDRAEDGSSFTVNANADGQNLDRIIVQTRDPGEPGWSDWRSTSCGDRESCSFSQDYSVSGAGEKEFRARAYAGEDRKNSEAQTVDFVSSLQPGVDSVTLNGPSEAEEGTSFDLTASANGNELDQIIIQEKDPGDSGWTDWRSTSCSGSSCSFTRSFSVPEGDNSSKDFRARASAGSDRMNSDVLNVDFTEDVEYRIDSITLDGLPSEHSTGTPLRITGDASGLNLEELVLKKRLEGTAEWTPINTTNCGSSTSCSITHDFTRSTEGEVDFKLVAHAGPKEAESQIEAVTFRDEEEDEPRVDTVNIDDLPEEKALSENLDITGEAQGNDIGWIILQKRNSTSGWEKVTNQTCSNSDTCDFDYNYNQDHEEEVDFRLKAVAGSDQGFSTIETVEFIDTTEEDHVDFVVIDKLPSEHPEDENLSIAGNAQGKNLDKIRIQKNEGSGWSNISSSNCGDSSSCSIVDEYDPSGTGEVRFRIKAEAGSDQEFSSEEVVDIVTPRAITSISINELPDRERINTDVNIEGEMEGENLEIIKVQKRMEGTAEWVDIASSSCSGSSCTITETFSTSNPEEVDFRIFGRSGSETANTEYQSVEFYRPTQPEITSVSINNLPETQSTGESMEIIGSARGRMLSNVAIQTKGPGDGSWSNLTQKDCGLADRCSKSTIFSSTNEGEHRFRTKAYAGEQTSVSTTRVVEIVNTTQPPRIDNVNIDNLPAQHPTDSSLIISGSASGNKLDTLKIQSRATSGGTWSTIDSISCEQQDTCGIDTSFSNSQEESLDFRLKAEAGSNEATSSTETVQFVEQPVANSVTLDKLPNTYHINTDLGITGRSNGIKLDSLKLEKRDEGTAEWTLVNVVNCNQQSTCSMNYNFQTSQVTEKDFRLKSIAGSSTKISQIESVNFIRPPPEDLIDSVTIQLPDRAQVGEEVDINATAEGEQLDRLVIQRKEGNVWVDVETQSCSGSPCDASIEDYTSDEPVTKDYRAKAFADGQSETSLVKSITFVEAQGLNNVEINDLPAQHPINTDLEIRGTAEGHEITAIEIQKKEDNESDWNTLSTKNCGSSNTCQIERIYESDDEVIEDFRVVGYAAGENMTSRVETVEFFEPTDPEEPKVLSVSMDELPGQYETDTDLEINGGATGVELDSIEIQKRMEGTAQWEEVKEKNCNDQSSCSITKPDFESDIEQEIDFRVKAEAGTDTAYSEIESVNFVNETEDGDKEDAELTVRVEDEDKDPIEDAEVRVENGEDETEETNEDGEAFFTLEPDHYNITASKEGFEDETEDVTLNEGEDETVVLTLKEENEDNGDNDDEEGVKIIRTHYSSEVCKGNKMDVNVVLSNSGGQQDVAVEGLGLEGANAKIINVDENSVAETNITFNKLKTTGQRNFRVRVTNSVTHTVHRSVGVKDCDDKRERPQLPTGITEQLDPRTVLAGETVRVHGDLINSHTSRKVRIYLEGDRVATVNSEKNGNYQAFIEPQEVGNLEVKAESTGVSATRTLRVQAPVRVEFIDAPRSTFEGRQIELCAMVHSPVEARVLLQEDGDTIDATNGNGRICFNTTAGEEGTTEYKFRAITQGQTSEAKKEVRVYEAGREVSSFPGQIASVETEPGIVKVTLYNNRDSVTTYDLELNDLDERWVSQTEKRVVLPKGSQEEVFFYFSPRDSGNFRPEVTVTTNGREVFSEEVIVESLEKSEEKRGILASLDSLLSN